MSKIEWTDRSDWNPIRGCTRVSPGCGGPGKHGGCYAEAIAARFSGFTQPFEGFAERTPHGPRWTGKVAIQWDRLMLPLSWRKPAKIFANSMSDWFHEALEIEEIATLYAVAVAAVHLRKHTFQILTKRTARMRKVLNSEAFWDQVNAEASAHVLALVDPLDRRRDDARATLDDYGPDNPPPGIWLGVSAEDQPRADERIPDLLAAAAAIRFVSAEPLLGEIRVDLLDDPTGDVLDALTGKIWNEHGSSLRRAKLDWIITGGESGPRARGAPRAWFRSIRDQCATAGVAYLHKQNGEWIDADEWLTALNKTGWKFTSGMSGFAGREAAPPLNYTDAQALARVQGFRFEHQSDGSTLLRVGKSRAGRLLDGVEHNAFPTPTLPLSRSGEGPGVRVEGARGVP